MKGRAAVLIGVVLVFFAASYALKKGRAEGPAPGPSGVPFERIVSLAPSNTEILFALGLEEKLVGVTDFCDYPPEALKKPKVGGYYTPSYETVVNLRPDVVLVLPEHDEIRDELRAAGLNLMRQDHRNVEGILASIAAIGDACGAPDRGRSLVEEIRARMEAVRVRTEGREKPRVLVCVGRYMDGSTLKSMTVGGRRGYYDDLIRMAGGVNALETDIRFPSIPPEGIVAMDPDVIIDLVPDLVERKLNPDDILREWGILPGVAAVKNRRVHVFGADYTIIPGPRFVDLLEDMEKVIHPGGIDD